MSSACVPGAAQAAAADGEDTQPLDRPLQEMIPTPSPKRPISPPASPGTRRQKYSGSRGEASEERSNAVETPSLQHHERPEDKGRAEEPGTLAQTGGLPSEGTEEEKQVASKEAAEEQERRREQMAEGVEAEEQSGNEAVQGEEGETPKEQGTEKTSDKKATTDATLEALQVVSLPLTFN